MRPPVTVVLVHRNQPARCVDTGRRFLASDVPVRLLVVDNGSPPAALAEVARGLPGAACIELGANTGFGPAANAGFRAWLAEGPAAGELCALAPHDALPEPDCVRLLAEAMEARPRAGLACAEVGEPRTPALDPYFGGITLPRRSSEGWEDAGYPHGTLLMARRACLEQIGLFDERYFAYCEEADLGARATAAGWEVGIVWGARVRNPSISHSRVVNDYLMMRNTLLFVREHSGRYHAGIRLLLAVWQTAVGALSARHRPPIFSARGRWLAMRDFLRGRVGPPPAALLP